MPEYRDKVVTVKLWPFIDYPWWRWIKKLKQRRARKRLTKMKAIVAPVAKPEDWGERDVTVRMAGKERVIRIHREES